MMTAILGFLKGIGGALLATAAPAVGKKIIEEFNSVSEEKLDEKKSTGTEVANAIQKLPPEAQERLLQSQVMRDIAEIKAGAAESRDWYELQHALLQSEEKGSKVRPRIVAVMVFLVFVGISCALGSQMFIVYKVAEFAKSNPLQLANIAMIQAAMPSYTVWAAILAFPIWVIRSFMGDRSEDKRVRASAITGQDIQPKQSLSSRLGEVVVSKVIKKK